MAIGSSLMLERLEPREPLRFALRPLLRDARVFVGFLAANYNDDIYFKYASYRMAFGYCISEIRKRDKELAKELWQTVNKGIIKDYNASYKHWQQFKNPFEPLVKKGYNAYLKANKQDKGVESYNYVVDLLISYFETSKPNSK